MNFKNIITSLTILGLAYTANAINTEFENHNSINIEMHDGLEPEVVFGSIVNGSTDVELEKATSLYKVQVKLAGSDTFSDFFVKRGTVVVDGVDGEGEILRSGALNETALDLIKSAAGKTVTLHVVSANAADQETELEFTFMLK